MRRSVGIRVGLKVEQLKSDWHFEVQSVLNLWKALNKGANLIELPTSKHSTVDNNRQPVDAFYNQELNFAIRLLRNIHKSLAAVNHTIRGNTKPSPTVSDTVFHLLQLQVNIKSSRGRPKGIKHPRQIFMQNIKKKTIDISLIFLHLGEIYR